MIRYEFTKNSLLRNSSSTQNWNIYSFSRKTMIKFFRKKEQEQADLIEEQFKNLVLAYQVTILPENDSRNWYIVDGDNTIEGEFDFEEWFRDLEDELTWQRSISGDACYIDPKSGKIC